MPNTQNVQSPGETAVLIQEFGAGYASEEELLALGEAYTELSQAVRIAAEYTIIPTSVIERLRELVK